jgi:hypothetical protein
MIADVARGAPRRRQTIGFSVATMLGALLFGALIVRQPGFVAVAVPGIAMLLLVLVVTKALTPQAALNRVLTWTLGAFALHLAIGLIIESRSGLVSFFGGDAVTYSTGATYIYQHWIHGTAIPRGVLPVGKAGFYYLLAALYWAFGIHPQAGIAVNAGIAALVIPVLTDATRRHFGDAATRAVPVLGALLPGFLIWGSQLLREAGIYLMLAVALNCAVRLMHRSSLGPIALLVAAIGLLFTFRADVAVLAGAGLTMAIMFGRRQVIGGLISGLGTVALILALVVGGGFGYSGYQFVTNTNLQQVNNVRADSSQSAASGFLPNADVSNTRHAVRYLPLGSAFFALGPAPWQLHNVRQVSALPDLLVWWFLLPSLWRGAREAWRRRGREVLVYLLPALFVTVGLALLVANFGTVVRERMQVVILLIPLISLGWSVRHPARPTASNAASRRKSAPARVSTAGSR